MNLQYLNLKNHIQTHIGHNKKYDAIAKEKLPQKKHTYSTINEFFHNVKQGSTAYRKIIERQNKAPNVHNPTNWKKKLSDPTTTSNQVKKAIIHLQSKYLDSSQADFLARLKLGKTLFKNQLFTIGLTDDKTCETCSREYEQSTTEDYQHALFLCPAVHTVIQKITETFFPNINGLLSISDILVSITKDVHPLYKGPTGQELASLIWDLFQVFIIQCRSRGITPKAQAAIIEIRSHIERIRKCMPKTKLALHINTHKDLKQIIKGANQPQDLDL